MARPKRTAKVVALAAAIVPFLSAGLAGAAVTSPGAAEVWRTGETKTIVWGALTDGTAGTFALSLYDASGQIDADPSDVDMDDIVTGLGSATDTSYAWTIPAGLVGADRYIKIHGDTGTTPWTGAAQDSDVFEIAHPLPAITFPVANGTLRVGAPRTITFIVPNASTGTAKLILKQNGTPVDLDSVTAGVQDQIGASFDTATATSVSWTAPDELLGTGYTITLTGDSTVELPATPYAGSDIVSGSFEIIHDTSIFSPSATSNWRAEETRIIEFVPPLGATGTAALWLWNGTANVDADPDEAGTQPIATGLDLEVDDSFSWVIPAGITLSDTARIRLTGDGGAEEYTGAAIVSSPFILRAAPPVPRFTTPGQDQRWHQGETKTITWVVDEAATGIADVWLVDSNDAPVDTNPSVVGVQPLANDIDVTAVTTASWTIPATLSGTGYYFALTNTGALEDDYNQLPIESAEFDVYPVGAAELRLETTVADKAAITEKVAVKWHDDGTTGATVDINLLRNDGGQSPTSTSVVKGLAKSTVCNSTTHECEYTWTVDAKTAVDSGAGTYKLQVVPALGVSDKTDAFAITDRALTLTSWGALKSVKAGAPVKIEWTAAGDLGTLKIEAVPQGNGAGKPIVLEAKYDASLEEYIWYPTQLQAEKTYVLKVTSSMKNLSKVAFTGTMAHFVTVTAQTSITLGGLSGVTANAATLGQPIVVSWGFGEAQNAAVKASPAVDISLMDSNGKFTKVVTGVKGDFDDQGKARRTYTVRPSAKVKPGLYSIVVTVTGSTDEALKGTSAGFTLAAPSSLTLNTPEASDSIERGGEVEVEWAWSSKSELPVNINLVNTASGKAIALAKAVVGTDGNGVGSAKVVIPGKGTTAGTGWKIQVVSADDKTKVDDAAVTLTDPTLAVTAPAGTGNNKVTWYRGQSREVSWTLGSDGVALTKLEIVAASEKTAAKPKVLATIHKGAAATSGNGTVHFVMPAKIAAGDYVVRATATDISTTAVVSDEFAIASSAIETVTAPTSAVKGASATIKWKLAQETTDDVKVELFQNGTLVAKIGTISKKATTYSGYGNLSWAIPATATAGSGYVIRVTSLSDSTKTADSSSFTIAAS